MINKWTLKIKDSEIRKNFQKFAMDNVMSKSPFLIGFQVWFVIATLPALYNGGYLSVVRTTKSVIGLLILAIPYFLTRKTKTTIFVKFMPFLYACFMMTTSNYIVYYTLGEEG